ncbi:MAG: response regulator transcription factor [Saprospiraceae bacterium]|nr:response regulator transcription factor [Saprospiraceae bacterium]
MNDPTILIIDDEVPIQKLLEITLTAHGFKTTAAATAKEGLTFVAMHPPDLVLLDLGLPDDDGQNVLVKLREWFTNPIIILSVRAAEEDIVRALDRGANDYLLKPFRTGELLARIRSALRLSQGLAHVPVQEFGNLVIDLAARTVRKNGEQVKLTATEFSLLKLLVRNEGKVLTHAFILREIWGPGYVQHPEYPRVFIGQLRKKIEDNANQPKFIVTESGVGYRFVGG